jgi:hypothetical protein
MGKTLFGISVFIVTQLSAGEIRKVFHFSRNDIGFGKARGFDVISFTESQGISGKAGYPAMPQINKLVLVPPTANVVKVEVIEYKKKEVSGRYFIIPIQPPVEISADKAPKFVPPNEVIYSSNNPYPKEVVKFMGTGSMGGYRVGRIGIRPLQYIPAKGKLILYTKIEIKITYAENKVSAKWCTKRQREVFEDILKIRLLNPEDIERWAPPIRESKQDEWEYIIITESGLRDAFRALAEWKIQKGVPTIIVTTDSIFANCPGKDEPEKMRNFIKEGFNNHGTIWVLLGGDPSETDVPMRDKTPPLHGGVTHTDWYFSDLDGDWNANGNSKYGEFGDEPDMHPDVFVGRAPVEDLQDVENFVNKVLIYESVPPNEVPTERYTTHFLFAQGLLSENNKKELNDSIVSVLSPHFTKIWLNVQETGPNRLKTANQVCDSIDVGIHFCVFTGHGNVDGWDCGSTMNVGNVRDLNNNSKMPIFHIEPCYVSRLSVNCICESFMKKYPGGTIATMGSWGKGVGTQAGFPGFLWWLDGFICRFFNKLFLHNINQLGKTISSAKDDWVMYALDETDPMYHREDWRHCFFTYTLLGDPEISVWTDTPKMMKVEQTFVSREDSLEIVFTISDSLTATPIPNALVCIRNEEQGIYERGRADNSGNATISIPKSITPVNVERTVTAHNYLPHIKQIEVGVEEACVKDEPKTLLLPIYPNQFFGRTVKINYILGTQAKVDLQIYDITGKMVQNLVSKVQGKGHYTVNWQAENTSAGVYFVRLATPKLTFTRKIILY